MSMNIEALVKKHMAEPWIGSRDDEESVLRAALAEAEECMASEYAALTEQAEAFKGELQAYDGMVRELTKTVEDMQAAQAVPVVGEPVAYEAFSASAPYASAIVRRDDVANERACSMRDAGHADAEARPLFAKPTHSIPAAELATLRELADAFTAERKARDSIAFEFNKVSRELEALRKDVERYRWLRKQLWNESDICVVSNPKEAVKLGHDCPSFVRLDDAIDAAIAQGKGE